MLITFNGWRNDCSVITLHVMFGRLNIALPVNTYRSAQDQTRGIAATNETSQKHTRPYGPCLLFHSLCLPFLGPCLKKISISLRSRRQLPHLCHPRLGRHLWTSTSQLRHWKIGLPAAKLPARSLGSHHPDKALQNKKPGCVAELRNYLSLLVFGSKSLGLDGFWILLRCLSPSISFHGCTSWWESPTDSCCLMPLLRPGWPVAVVLV